MAWVSERPGSVLPPRLGRPQCYVSPWTLWTLLSHQLQPSVSAALRPEPTHLVKVTEFPEENEQFLMELDFLCGVGKVGLEQGVGQQPSYPLKDKLEVLGGQRRVSSNQLPTALATPYRPPHSPFSLSISYNLQISSQGARVWTLLPAPWKAKPLPSLQQVRGFPLCKAAAPSNPQVDP